MGKLYFIIVAVSICIAGCSTSYTVHVNGFSELDKPMSRQASIYVATDPNSRNPIFDREIKNKIEMLLKFRGYDPAAKVELADYRLVFQLGLDSHKVSGYAPLYRPVGGFHAGYWGEYHFGYTSYMPYLDTLYDQWLVIKVFARDRATDSDAEKIVWIGETMTSTSVADLRRVADYLLVACFEYLGVDTKRQMTLSIGRDDSRIIRISNFRE